MWLILIPDFISRVWVTQPTSPYPVCCVCGKHVGRGSLMNVSECSSVCVSVVCVCICPYVGGYLSVCVSVPA